MAQFSSQPPTSHPGLALARALRDEMFAPPPPDLMPPDLISALMRAKAGDPGPFDPEDPDASCALAADMAPARTLLDHAKPVVARLSLALSLGQALAEAGVTQIGAAPGIARIEGWGLSSAETLRKLLSVAPLSDTVLADPARRAVIVDAGLGGQTGRDLAADRRRQQKEIDDALSGGRPVVLIAPDDAGLQPGQRALVDTVLTLPRPDRPMIAALLSLLWPDHAGRATAPETLAALPGDEDLGRLQPLQLEAALRRLDPDAAAAALARVTAQMVPHAEAAGLEAIVGQPALVNQLQALAGDVSAWRRGDIDWAQVPRSMLLYGPPGNGKTAAAHALAGQCRLPIVITSFAEAQGEGLHLGQTLATLASAFDSAIAQAPAILFLDEVDAIGSRAGHAGHNDFYMRAIVTGMLTMIDRALRTPGLILMAATNDPGAMDPALRRAGRFDQHLPVPAPGLDGLAEILRRALGPAAADVGAPALEAAAKRLAGGSGADAEALGRRVLARARAAGRPATAADLAACLAEHRPETTPEILQRIALHEAGHIVVGHLMGLQPPRRASVSPMAAGVEHPMPALMTLAGVEALLTTLLAGRASEVHFLGNASTGGGHGTTSDLAEATRLALHIDHAWHLETDAPLVWTDVSTPPRPGQLPREVATAVSRRLRAAEARARELVATHEGEIMAIASVLYQRIELDAADIADLLLQYLPHPTEDDAPCSSAASTPPCAP
ncbi:MAG: AAA family ATPase [Alkalilacustris sp.]